MGIQICDAGFCFRWWHVFRIVALHSIKTGNGLAIQKNAHDVEPFIECRNSKRITFSIKRQKEIIALRFKFKIQVEIGWLLLFLILGVWLVVPMDAWFLCRVLMKDAWFRS